MLLFIVYEIAKLRSRAAAHTKFRFYSVHKSNVMYVLFIVCLSSFSETGQTGSSRSVFCVVESGRNIEISGCLVVSLLIS